MEQTKPYLFGRWELDFKNTYFEEDLQTAVSVFDVEVKTGVNCLPFLTYCVHRLILGIRSSKGDI